MANFGLMETLICPKFVAITRPAGQDYGAAAENRIYGSGQGPLSSVVRYDIKWCLYSRISTNAPLKFVYASVYSRNASLDILLIHVVLKLTHVTKRDPWSLKISWEYELKVTISFQRDHSSYYQYQNIIGTHCHCFELRIVCHIVGNVHQGQFVFFMCSICIITTSLYHTVLMI